MRALVLLLVLSTPVAAQTPAVSGADDPAFAEARDAWLSGADDMATIARLSGLAGAGNVAARILLGSLVAQDLVPEAVEALPRAERIALTRAPGGLSGTSWLRAAGEGDPLAGALDMSFTGWSRVTPDEMIAPLETLLEAGEAAAALRVLATFCNMGGLGPTGGWTVTALHAGHPTLQGHGAPLLAGVGRLLTTAGSGVAEPAVVFAVKAALAALPDAPDLDAPLAALCVAGCPATADACTAALSGAVGGQVGFLTLSPVEGLIDSATYQASPRFAGDLRTRLSSAADRVAEADACAAGLLR